MKIRHGRVIIPVLLFALLAGSCTKQEEPTYFLRFKLNNQEITWRNVQSELGPDQARASSSFILKASNDKSTESFDIAITIPVPNLGMGVYPSDMYTIPISYTKDAGGELRSYQAGDVDGIADPMYTIELTSVTDNVIRGKFTGNYLVHPATKEVLIITEGNFVLPRKN